MKVITHQIKILLSNESLFLNINKRDYNYLLLQFPRGRQKLTCYISYNGKIVEETMLINWDRVECIEFFNYLPDLELEI